MASSTNIFGQWKLNVAAGAIDVVRRSDARIPAGSARGHLFAWQHCRRRHPWVGTAASFLSETGGPGNFSGGARVARSSRHRGGTFAPERLGAARAIG